MRANTGGDESNRSRYWVSGEAHTDGEWDYNEKKRERKNEATGK